MKHPRRHRRDPDLSGLRPRCTYGATEGTGRVVHPQLAGRVDGPGFRAVCGLGHATSVATGIWSTPSGRAKPKPRGYLATITGGYCATLSRGRPAICPAILSQQAISVPPHPYRPSVDPADAGRLHFAPVPHRVEPAPAGRGSGGPPVPLRRIHNSWTSDPVPAAPTRAATTSVPPVSPRRPATRASGGHRRVPGADRMRGGTCSI